jgi:PAS domain-containing protein
MTLFGFTQPGGQTALGAPLLEPAAPVRLRAQDGQPLQPADWPAMRVLSGETLMGTMAMDVVASTPDGNERFLNISGMPLLDEAGQVAGAVCVFRDRTELMQAERELAEQASQIESIFEAMVDGILLVDVTGHIIRMNVAQP